VVSVVAKDRDSPFGIFDDETIRREFAGDRREVLDRAIDAGQRHGVDVSGRVVVARSVHRGVRETARDMDADAILIGWAGRTRRAEAVLGTNVDTLVERTPHDVFVERIGATANGVDAVLVPVAGGPHAALAAVAGEAIADANDANVTLLSVAEPGTDRTSARERIARTMAELGVEAPVVAGGATEGGPHRVGGVEIETAVREGETVDAIVSAASDHDVVLMGATRDGHHRARLVGSIPRSVADRTDRTVVLAREWTGGTRLSRLLGRLRWS